MPVRSSRRSVPWSLLDRLTDDDPDNNRDQTVSSWQQAREFQEALCRDLTALLNTRRPEEPFDSSWDQCVDSVLLYGIPDYTAYNLTNEHEQELVRKSIERAVRLFEPRLGRVSVTMLKADPLQPVLRYQITCILRALGELDPVTFDVALPRDSRRIAVSGGE
jgi:type VI secretion system protein ImpF